MDIDCHALVKPAILASKLTLVQQLEQLKKAAQADPMPTLAHRLSRLLALKKSLLANKRTLCQALNQDYGQRSDYDSLIGDILPCITHINYTSKRLKKWLKPSRRHSGLLLTPAKVVVHYQPLGVVGIIVPWNFPVMLALGPLISAIAAGNRAMVKLSEFTPHCNAVLKNLLTEVFHHDELKVVEGDHQIASAFSTLAFDHLFFTGSTHIGKQVMAAAAPHLTPVTLELGGKSPCLIGPDVDVEFAAKRIFFGKTLNAGQICVAPDYLLLPKDKIEGFISAFRQQVERHYRQGVASPDYSSIINERQYQRLIDWLEEAKQAGAQLHPCAHPARDDGYRRLMPHLLTDVPEHCQMMQQEIFGPLLPIIGYDDIAQAIDYIQMRQRPLALYLISHDPKLQQKLINQTHSGSMAINDTLLQVAADDAPFGGIGASGMGHYHGHEGFLTFSKSKTVLVQGKIRSSALIHPPYRRWYQKLLMAFFLR